MPIVVQKPHEHSGWALALGGLAEEVEIGH